jgi:hypothetical protein
MANVSARYAKPMGIQCENPSREKINMKIVGANMCALSALRTIRHNVVLDVGQPYLDSSLIRWYARYMKCELEFVTNYVGIFDLNRIDVWFQVPKKPLVCKASPVVARLRLATSYVILS